MGDDLAQTYEHKTPWQKAFSAFGMSQRALGKKLGRDGAKINRAIHDEEGLINGEDQRRLLELAKALSVDLKPSDLVPQVDG